MYNVLKLFLLVLATSDVKSTVALPRSITSFQHFQPKPMSKADTEIADCCGRPPFFVVIG